MRLRPSTIFAAVLLACAGQSGAQLGLPGSLPALPTMGNLPGSVLGQANNLLEGTRQQVAATLNLVRSQRIDTLLRDNRGAVERDSAGEPARRGVLLLVDPDAATLAQVTHLGFTLGATNELDGLGVSVSQITLPRGMSLAAAQKLLRQQAPTAQVTSDQIYFQSGGGGQGGRAARASAAVAVYTPIGLIDGAAAQPVAATRGFAKGAPLASNHGSAVAYLAQNAGARRVMVADVYGADPAGGNALAIAQGLGWLVSKGARVISISLVGPRNPLLERAVSAAQARGTVIVAAVGNDGPAAPPSYPASYPGVLAVTGVDQRNRPLIEAGRAVHLDYAAPGADLSAQDRSGRMVAVRGTSFAAPLVAVRAAAALDAGASPQSLVGLLDREAQPLSRRRPDPQSGRGLLCGLCR